MGWAAWWRIPRPFVGGMRTDAPPWALDARESVFAQDAHARNGILEQRRAWAYVGSTPDVAAALTGVWSASHALSGAIRTYTASYGDIYIHNSGAAGTLIHASSDYGLGAGVYYQPRCVYRDEVIWCDYNGKGGIIRTAGSAVTATDLTGSAPAQYTADIPTTALPSGAAAGMFIRWAYPHGVYPGADYYFRVLAVNGGTATVEGIRWVASGLTGLRLRGMAAAYAFPAVKVMDVGAIKNSGSATVTGSGTKFTGGGAYPLAGMDAILHLPKNGTAQLGGISAIASDTSLTAGGLVLSITNFDTYAITRRLPFRDCASHKGSLFGAGVPQHPGNLYVGPPDWDLSFPPGATFPFDPTAAAALQSSSPDTYFLMDVIPVPAQYDGDPIVAVLSTPGPLLVLKEKSVYRVDGSHPTFDVELVGSGVGCADISGAISVGGRVFWAGEAGVFTFDGRSAVNLMRGKIEHEWRRVAGEPGTIPNLCCGIADRFLFVSVRLSGGSLTKRLYVYDLVDGTWISRWSNLAPRNFFSVAGSGGVTNLYAVDSDASRQGRILDLAPCVDGTGGATDPDGTGPVLKAWSGQQLPPDQSTDDETRLLEVAVSTNLHDTGAAGASTLVVTTTHSGRVDSAVEETVAAGTIQSDATDLIDRNVMRVGVRGRRHQIRVEAGSVASTLVRSEVHEVAVRVRAGRDGR